MSRHKSISTATRKKLYEKYNHRCAYCGCELEYKDMRIDHVESVYRNNDIAQTMSEKEMYDESNLLPACRQCNFYKSTFTIEQFRQRLKEVMMPNLQKDFRYRLAVKYGLIKETDKSIIFYYETLQKGNLKTC